MISYENWRQFSILGPNVNFIIFSDSNQEREQNEDLHDNSFTIDELEAVDACLYHVMETVLRQTHVDLPTGKVEYSHDPLEDHKNYLSKCKLNSSLLKA